MRTLLAGVLMMVTSIVPAVAAADPASYPEFPYPHTNYDEPLRGQYHFSPRAGWMNDINAPLYYRGTYHLFFQHNPHGLSWDTMHWGHATSPTWCTGHRNRSRSSRAYIPVTCGPAEVWWTPRTPPG